MTDDSSDDLEAILDKHPAADFTATYEYISESFGIEDGAKASRSARLASALTIISCSLVRRNISNDDYIGGAYDEDNAYGDGAYGEADAYEEDEGFVGEEDENGSVVR